MNCSECGKEIETETSAPKERGWCSLECLVTWERNRIAQSRQRVVSMDEILADRNLPHALYALIYLLDVTISEAADGNFLAQADDTWITDWPWFEEIVTSVEDLDGFKLDGEDIIGFRHKHFSTWAADPFDAIRAVIGAVSEWRKECAYNCDEWFVAHVNEIGTRVKQAFTDGELLLQALCEMYEWFGVIRAAEDRYGT